MEITYENQFAAAALFDGGWRSTDRDELIREYDLSETEVDELCEALKEIEEEQSFTED